MKCFKWLKRKVAIKSNKKEILAKFRMANERYQQGKIYKLINPNMPDKIYIGATCEPKLCKTLSGLRRNRNKSSYKDLIDGNEKIILIENFPCKTKDELVAKQQEHLDTNKNICVNFKGIKQALVVDRVQPPMLPGNDGFDFNKYRKFKCLVCDGTFTINSFGAHERTKKHSTKWDNTDWPEETFTIDKRTGRKLPNFKTSHRWIPLLCEEIL
jgi:hypothetical protein